MELKEQIFKLNRVLKPYDLTEDLKPSNKYIKELKGKSLEELSQLVDILHKRMDVLKEKYTTMQQKKIEEQVSERLRSQNI